jgi:hypothetical protein
MTTTPSTPEGLPNLPELPFSPLLSVNWADRTKTRTLFTADQMQAYALAAIAAQQEKVCAPENTESERQADLSLKSEIQAKNPDHWGSGVCGGVPEWHVEYSNDTGPTDESFYEWWEVTNGYAIYTAHTAESAEKLCAILNATNEGDGA